MPFIGGEVSGIDIGGSWSFVAWMQGNGIRGFSFACPGFCVGCIRATGCRLSVVGVL